MKKKITINKKWILHTFLMTFILAIIFSIVSEALIRKVNFAVAVLLLLVIVSVGVFFDAIGIAVAAADEKPFHAMAASKVKSAKYSIRLIKNASKVSNFCNDVIGDIAGIVSGTTIGIIMGFFRQYNIKPEIQVYITIAFSGVIAALTVGGKAIGKEIAISKSKEVVDLTGKVIYFFDVLTLKKTFVHNVKIRKE
jgi:CBS domain containing-hemolysin-like protein